MFEMVTGSLRYISQIRNSRMLSENRIIDVNAVLIETEFIILFPLSVDFLQVRKTLIL